MITSPEQAIAEAIRTGKSVEVHRPDGSVRVVVSVPGRDVSNEDDLRAEVDRLRAIALYLADEMRHMDRPAYAQAYEAEITGEPGALMAETDQLRHRLATAEKERDELARNHALCLEDLAHVRKGLHDAREILVDGGVWGHEHLVDAARRTKAERDAAIAAIRTEASRVVEERDYMENERDTYRAMLCDLVAAYRGGISLRLFEAARDLLKHGPNLTVMPTEQPWSNPDDHRDTCRDALCYGCREESSNGE